MSVVRLSRSSVGEDEAQAVARVIADGYLGMGREVQLFEDELRAHLETDAHVICVNTGTSALHLALAGLDIGPGDEVLVPTITYVASFQAVSATGARPVACDVTRDRVFIDLEDAERRVTARTRAIMPVHYASDGRDIAEVYAFATRHGLRVIEDAAHGFGCRRDGRPVGSSGDVVCFSFDGIKNITCGEGGALVTSDDELAARVRDARLLGVERDTEARYAGARSWTFEVHHQGFRFHMSNLMAAIGRVQLRKLPKFAEHRRRAAARYREAFSGLNGLVLLDLDWASIVPHIFVVRIVDGRRDELMAHLRSTGIECGLHYQPNHLLTYYADGVSLPNAETLNEQLISLPLHAELSDADQRRVIDTVIDFLRGADA